VGRWYQECAEVVPAGLVESIRFAAARITAERRPAGVGIKSFINFTNEAPRFSSFIWLRQNDLQRRIIFALNLFTISQAARIDPSDWAVSVSRDAPEPTLERTSSINQA
jgi:hypothetical protein